MGTDTSTPVVPRSSVERIALSAMMSLYMSCIVPPMPFALCQKSERSLHQSSPIPFILYNNPDLLIKS